MVAPSENLVRAYLEKSRTAIKSMELNANAGPAEWAVSASYYARYFAVFAILSKRGKNKHWAVNQPDKKLCSCYRGNNRRTEYGKNSGVAK